MQTESGNQDTRRDGKPTEISRQIETKRKLDPKGAVRFVRKSLDLSENTYTDECADRHTSHLHSNGR